VRIAVCEMHPEMVPESDPWKVFAARVRRGQPEILLLNEMPFGPWIAAGEQPDAAVIARSQHLHDQGIAALEGLGVPWVLGSQPRNCRGRNVNEAFVWTKANGAIGVHTKQYFPDEGGFYEARWYQAGDPHFRVAEAGGLRLGFLICSELMFNEHARHYRAQGAHMIAVPRATPAVSLARWMVAMRMAAVVSGCYVASSNRGGLDSKGLRFGGSGWIVDPNGEVVAQTSEATPVVFYDLNLAFVERAQRDYPCYIPELAGC
jgi:N-carbamoylputrescine amidase